MAAATAMPLNQLMELRPKVVSPVCLNGIAGPPSSIMVMASKKISETIADAENKNILVFMNR